MLGKVESVCHVGLRRELTGGQFAQAQLAEKLGVSKRRVHRFGPRYSRIDNK